MTKPPNEPSRKQSETLAARIAWLLATVWNGNQSEMARALKCTPSYVGKVVSGGVEPGRRLLEDIARHTGIAVDWLLTGRGRALSSSSIPLATELLTVPPQEWPSRAGSVDGFDHLFSPTRYWLRVPDRHQIELRPEHGVRGRDLLLIEADRQMIEKTLKAAGHGSRWLCIANLIDEQGVARVELVAAIYKEEKPDLGHGVGSLEVEPYGPVPIVRTTLDRYPSGELKVFEQHLMAERDPRSRSRARLTQPRHLWPNLRASDLLGLCVLAVRNYGTDPVRVRWDSPPSRPGQRRRKRKRKG